MSSRSRSRPPKLKIDSYYRFVLSAVEQADVANENEQVDDRITHSLKTLYANLEEIPKRCWKRSIDSLEAILHFSFLFCGVEAFAIVLRHNRSASLRLPPKLENEFNGLNRLVRKVVKRVLDDRDWREDVVDVLRQAQRAAMLIFYMLKSRPPNDVEEKIQSGDSTQMKASLIDEYLKERLDRLINQLDSINLTARTSSNFVIRTLSGSTEELRKGVLIFSCK